MPILKKYNTATSAWEPVVIGSFYITIRGLRENRVANSTVTNEFFSSRFEADCKL